MVDYSIEKSILPFTTNGVINAAGASWKEFSACANPAFLQVSRDY